MNYPTIRFAACAALVAMLWTTRPAAAQTVRYEEEITLGNSSQNITSMGLCMRASHQEAKGVSVPATIGDCTNRTWYPYRFIVQKRQHLGSFRHIKISLRTRQDLCLDISPESRASARPDVVMAPCDNTGSDMFQHWGIVPIHAEYGYGNGYVLINVGASSLKKTMVLHAGPPGSQLMLADYVPGPWKPDEARQYWYGGEFWCQVENGTHVDGWVTGRTWVYGERKPDAVWPHCSN